VTVSPAALSLVILVASGSSNEPATTAMLGAVREALGGNAAVLVREVPPERDGASVAEPQGSLMTDDEAVALGASLHADAIVELQWRDADHRRALLHVRVRSEPRWADREVGFDALDAQPERGRMIGFAVASMMPDDLRVPPIPPAPPVQPVLPPEGDTPPAPRPVPTPAKPVRWRGAVDAAVTGSLGGNATGIGGELSGRWDFAPRFSLRLGAGARGGQVASAGASSFVLSGAVGLVWRLVAATDRSGFGLSARVDFLGIRDQVNRPSTDGGATQASLVLPGADAALEASWLFRSFSVFAAVGAEGAFGATPIYVHSQEVATIPPVRGVAELGGRLHF
jgi:hypothetical protein